MSTDRVVLKETKPIKKIKYCIIGVPGVGLVGAIAVNYTVRALNMTEIGYLESELFPPIIVVHEGNPKPPFRIYSKDDVVILTSEIPLPPEVLTPTARSIVTWAKEKDTELLISISGVTEQNRLLIDTPLVYGVGSNKSALDLLNSSGVESFEEGFMAGLQAIIMNESIKKDLLNVILLAQSHYQYPDPAAAASVLGALNKLSSLKVDVTQLLAEAEEIRVRTRELMQRTQRSMQRVPKEQEQELPGMYV